MKIAVVSSGHIPSQWAHSINIAKNADAFFSLGHNIEIITIERFKERRIKKTIKSVHRFYGINEGIKIKYFRDNPFFYFEEIKPFDLFPTIISRLLQKDIRGIFDPEKKISKYCKNNGVNYCYCRRARRAVIHNISNKVPTIVEEHTPPSNRPDIQNMLKFSCTKYFKILVTVSDVLKKEFMKNDVPEEKILVLQNGVDLKNFENLPTKDEVRRSLGLPKDKLVIYSGSLFPDKGIEHVLLVAKNLPEINFILIGGRRHQVEFWKDYARINRIRNVQFLGFIENSRIPFFLKSADALIMPYKTDQDISIMDINSTSPLKLFEYMASKKPIISTNIPAISRTITHGKNGLLAKPNDIEELTKFAKIVLDDYSLAEKLSRNAYSEVIKYDVRERCRKILSKLD